MAEHLYKKVDDMSYDKLISGMTPPPKTAAGVLAKLGAAAAYSRGTVLCRSSGAGGDGKLKILGTAAASNETLTPDCILCDGVDIGTADDVNAAVYVAGCFNPEALTVKEGYAITQDDIDKLRERGLYLAALLD